ncbi:hypothetical protein RchiOBHm_Chr5g0080331 [Rosa chinensis]|uniref:Uncharacterized protein n=1 Tax=Rosa chinensis TaxID=74649 RepID=A0A2P6QMS5_ROSCH|nr:hypothetical protein RchiOBHm_Chr5g0080331 [Rosa chinensis]
MIGWCPMMCWILLPLMLDLSMWARLLGTIAEPRRRYMNCY